MPNTTPELCQVCVIPICVWSQSSVALMGGVRLSSYLLSGMRGEWKCEIREHKEDGAANIAKLLSFNQ